MKYLPFVFFIVLATACSSPDKPNGFPDDTWDLDKNGIPRFVADDYIELALIDSISRFRSGVGHDYSDAFEHCRSLKHYFKPQNGTDWALVGIFSPVTGRITRAEQEWAGTKFEIESADRPAFRFVIFHVNPSTVRPVGETVAAGEQLGTHIGPQTMSDIAVIVNDPTRQGRMVSYFEVMTDSLFNEYINRGVTDRQELIISRPERDANPLSCNGDQFVSVDTLENWVGLK